LLNVKEFTGQGLSFVSSYVEAKNDTFHNFYIFKNKKDCLPGLKQSQKKFFMESHIFLILEMIKKSAKNLFSKFFYLKKMNIKFCIFFFISLLSFVFRF